MKLTWAESENGDEGGLLSSLTALSKWLNYLLACSVQQGIFTRRHKLRENVLSLNSYLRQLKVEL